MDAPEADALRPWCRAPAALRDPRGDGSASASARLTAARHASLPQQTRPAGQGAQVRQYGLTEDQYDQPCRAGSAGYGAWVPPFCRRGGSSSSSGIGGVRVDRGDLAGTVNRPGESGDPGGGATGQAPGGGNRRSRSRLGSQGRAGPSRVSICIQAVSSLAMATSSHQIWIWSRPARDVAERGVWRRGAGPTPARHGGELPVRELPRLEGMDEAKEAAGDGGEPLLCAGMRGALCLRCTAVGWGQRPVQHSDSPTSRRLGRAQPPASKRAPDRSGRARIPSACLGDGHADRVMQPVAWAREPGQELMRAAPGVSADQHLMPPRGRSPGPPGDHEAPRGVGPGVAGSRRVASCSSPDPGRGRQRGQREEPKIYFQVRAASISPSARSRP